jgi:hypothetical protein
MINQSQGAMSERTTRMAIPKTQWRNIGSSQEFSLSDIYALDSN